MGFILVYALIRVSCAGLCIAYLTIALSNTSNLSGLTLAADIFPIIIGFAGVQSSIGTTIWAADTSVQERWFYLGTADCIMNAFLILSLGLQADFTAFTRDQCDSIPQHGQAVTRFILFERLVVVRENYAAHGRSTCLKFLTLWYIGLVLLFITTLLVVYSFTQEGSREKASSVCREIRKDLSEAFKFGGYYGPLVALLELVQFASAVLCLAIFHCYRIFFKRWVEKLLRTILWTISHSYRTVFKGYLRYYWRYMRVKFTQMSAPKHVQTRSISLGWRLKQNINGTATELALTRLLQPAILKCIAAELHYEDLVNLSLASRRVREIMFPTHDTNENALELRVHSCRWQPQKESCWVCNIQICNDCCGTTKRYKDSHIYYHMNLCVAKCSNCFYTRLLHQGLHKSMCACRDARDESATAATAAAPRRRSWRTRFWRSIGSTRGWRTRPTNNVSTFPRVVCRGCAALSDDNVAAVRTKRAWAEYQHLASQPLGCSDCGVFLPSHGAARWWVCSKCQRECRSRRCHPQQQQQNSVARHVV